MSFNQIVLQLATDYNTTPQEIVQEMFSAIDIGKNSSDEQVLQQWNEIDQGKQNSFIENLIDFCVLKAINLTR